MNSSFSSWINGLPIESSPREGVVTPRHPRQSPTSPPTEKHSQHVDLKENTRPTDTPRHILEGGGPNAPRSGAAQDQHGADVLTDTEQLFWHRAVDEAAFFLDCREDDRAMMHRHLIEYGWAYVLPLRALLVAHGLSICRQPEFMKVRADQ